VVVLKEWGIGQQMCKKTRTILKRNDKEENEKHIPFCTFDI
jgi:hypothetical protein